MRRLCSAPRTVAALVATAALAGSAQLAAPERAAAVDGVYRINKAWQGENVLLPYKTVTASCAKPHDVVLGGGAVIDDGGRKKARLVTMRPHGLYFTAKAEAPSIFEWTMTTYAICAPLANLDSLHYVQTTDAESPPSSATFQHTQARCGPNTVAYGSGASVLPKTGFADGVGQARVGLQLMRTSGPLDITRAAGREVAEGYDLPWRIKAWAVCAKPQGGIHAEGEIAQGADASSRCDGTALVHGAGGGGGLTDGGPVWLRQVQPLFGLREVRVGLTGPLHPSIGGMVAHHTCAN